MHAKCQRACGLCSLQETEGASKKLVQQPLLQEVSIELERLRDEYERLRSAKGLAEQEVEQTKQDADHMQQLNNICEDALAWTRQELKSSQQGRHKLQMEANGLRHEEQLAQAILRTAQAEAEFLRQNQSHVEKLNAELRHSLQLMQNDVDQAQRERRQVENRLDEFKAALMGTQGGPLRYPQSNKCGTTTESNFTAWTWTESASQSLAVLFPFGCGAACVAFCGSPGKSGKRSREVAVQTSSLLGDHLHVLSQREDLCTTDSSGVSASSGTSDFLSELSNPCSVQPATHGGVLTSSHRACNQPTVISLIDTSDSLEISSANFKESWPIEESYGALPPEMLPGHLLQFSKASERLTDQAADEIAVDEKEDARESSKASVKTRITQPSVGSAHEADSDGNGETANRRGRVDEYFWSGKAMSVGAPLRSAMMQLRFSC